MNEEDLKILGAKLRELEEYQDTFFPSAKELTEAKYHLQYESVGDLGSGAAYRILDRQKAMRDGYSMGWRECLNFLSRKEISKHTLTISVDTDEDLIPYSNAVKNKIKLENIYNDVFRPIIKYSQDEKLVAAYELVWEKLGPYLHDEE